MHCLPDYYVWFTVPHKPWLLTMHVQAGGRVGYVSETTPTRYCPSSFHLPTYLYSLWRALSVGPAMLPHVLLNLQTNAFPWYPHAATHMVEEALHQI
jgi:hypothetical protein